MAIDDDVMQPTAPVLSVEALSFGYANRPLFHDWSHVFRPGLTWIRGDNGCGKSTLLRLLAGALDPDSGRVCLGDIDARADPVDYRRRVAWSGPAGPATGDLKPLEFFASVAGRYASFDPAMPPMLVDALGLEPFLARRIDQLSTGSRNKVGVIAAIAAGTPVVLLDEPLAGLDRVSGRVLNGLLADASRQRQRLWIVASHAPLDDAADAAHRLDLPSNDG